MAANKTVTGLLMYAAVALTLVGGIGAGAAAIVKAASAIHQQSSSRTKSPLESRIESAREIREALAKPVAHPQPLAPITAKLANPAAKVAARPAPRRNTDVAMTQARQAFAQIDRPQFERPQTFFEMLAFGPRN
jgi:hypothetical protein